VHYFIGIDDTDDVVGPGTGHRARALGGFIATDNRGELAGITRHQLLVAPGVPYTSHNSSACLAVTWHGAAEALANLCRGYLVDDAAPGSDVGLCIVPAKDVGESIQFFGHRAKCEIVDMAEAFALAAGRGILLEGLTGTRCGVIGALSAVGLRATGGDGRFIWLRGARELSGIYARGWLCAETGIDEVATLDGTVVPEDATVNVGNWVRPVLRNWRATLLVESADGTADGRWRCVSRDVVKACSN